MNSFFAIAFFLTSIAATPTTTSAPAEAKAAADTTKKDDALSAETLGGLKLRCIGPALSSGRIGDFAVNPANRHEYFAAVASGGVWKTLNGGTTWTPVFDGEGSYSIGCLALDPKNPHVVWVGTGENNSQRSVGFGDGVYRSRDGGASWENLGLKESEHIGMIAIDPRDSNVVYVAAQGPLWRSGGDRGLYKTSDGGKTWSRILHISDDTGVNEVHLDPRDPNVMYASAYQRRRHVWTLVNGGPESAIYKTTDGGANWRKITSGLPEVDKGRIGLDIAPANPDVVYAIIEAADAKGGFFRSTDRGESWTKQSDYTASGPQYYHEIVCDPKNVDRVYSLDTFLHVTQDGGKTFKRMPGRDRHVDDHALWIDPNDTDYLLMGCDGGVYESFDRGENWDFKSNLPITQFYRVAVDNSEPFYFVYGGTQDNNTLGGPSRTRNPAGIANEDWFITVGGDGFQIAIDLEDPNIVYSEWQYGGLVRYDRRSGEAVDIKPRENPDDEPLKWNWDSPLIISPHDHKRLYFSANRLFRSDDRGNSWEAISGDLSRGLDRNSLPVMGKIQNADAVAKNKSTSIYGNTVSLCESPRVEGLLYVGTDDGLVHVTADGGKSWRKIEVFPRVPDVTYVSCLRASRHADDVVFATFDNHQNGDFKPYILRSENRGESWKPIHGDLPEREVVYSIAEDAVNKDLLFAGTEFGVYVTVDAGQHWIKLKGGMPTIAVRDIALQDREVDLVLGTFGRGFYVLDDYTPLRGISKETLEKDAVLFPVKDALRYSQTSRFGGASGRGWQGASYYMAPNPPFGATCTYYLKEKIMTRREKRKEAEKKAAEKGETPPYPKLDQLREEDEEKEPAVLLVISDEEGNVVRRVPGSREKGIQRATWDLRYPSALPISLEAPAERADWELPPAGPLAPPGTYTARLYKEVDGELTALAEAQEFKVVPLELGTFPVKDRKEVGAFQAKVARLQRAVQGAVRAAGDAEERLSHLRKAIVETPGAKAQLTAEAASIQGRLNRIVTALSGDQTRSKRDEPVMPSIVERVENVVGDQWYVTSAPTKTQVDAYAHAGKAFEKTLAELRELIEKDLAELEAKVESAGGPWTPGRVPDWKME